MDVKREEEEEAGAAEPSSSLILLFLNSASAASAAAATAAAAAAAVADEVEEGRMGRDERGAFEGVELPFMLVLVEVVVVPAGSEVADSVGVEEEVEEEAAVNEGEVEVGMVEAGGALLLDVDVEEVEVKQ